MTTVRAGRRRRLLHEGANEASSASNKQASETSSASGVRYAPAADSLSFSIARSLFPQTPAQITLVTIGTLGIVGLAALAAYLGLQSPEENNYPFTTLFAFNGTGTFGTWIASTLWLAVGFVAYVIYGLRRHKMDDLKSQYRWWIVAALSAVLMSFITSVSFHDLFANQMTAIVGWSALKNHAFWWLLSGVFLCGGLVIRMSMEQVESKASVALVVIAVLVTSVGWALEAGLVPESVQASYEWLGYAWLGSAMSTLGTACLLLGNLMYARNIVREADGLIARPEKTTASKSSASSSKASGKAQASSGKVENPSLRKSKSAEPTVEEEPSTISIAESTVYDSKAAETEQYYPSKAERRAEAKRRKKEALAQQADEADSRWVSGSESDYQDEYDDSDRPRKLSKAQRKRLRKQKARRAA